MLNSYFGKKKLKLWRKKISNLERKVKVSSLSAEGRFGKHMSSSCNHLAVTCRQGFPSVTGKNLAPPKCRGTRNKACPSDLYLCSTQSSSQPTLFYKYICFDTSAHFINTWFSLRKCLVKRLSYFSV